MMISNCKTGRELVCIETWPRSACLKRRASGALSSWLKWHNLEEVTEEIFRELP